MGCIWPVGHRLPLPLVQEKARGWEGIIGFVKGGWASSGREKAKGLQENSTSDLHVTKQHGAWIGGKEGEESLS